MKPRSRLVAAVLTAVAVGGVAVAVGVAIIALRYLPRTGGLAELALTGGSAAA